MRHAQGPWAIPLATTLTIAMSGLGDAAASPTPPTAKTKINGGSADPESGGREADDQHGGSEGHLPGSSKNVKLVGELDVSGATGQDRPGHIADLAVSGDHAYLAARRLNTDPCGKGGFYTVDISNPAKPKEVSFTEFPAGSYPGEGMQVIKMRTAAFKGDILVTNNEICSDTGSQVGGMSIYDVTDPRHIVPLAIGEGTPTTANCRRLVRSTASSPGRPGATSTP
ncbi:hypothetical protein ABZ806_27860 [Spirillospora sp. NPDC047418]